MNKYICTANLTRDPELSFVPASGKAYCKFGIAVNYGFGDNKKTSFLNCVAFDKKAEVISQYTHKGSKVLIEGEIQTGSYEKKDGSGKVHTTDIIVREIEFLDKKGEGQGKAAADGNLFDDGDDIFTPVDDDFIPF